MPRSVPHFELLAAALPLLAGCFGQDRGEVFMTWQRASVSLSVETPQEVEQVLWLAQERARQGDLRPLWQPIVTEALGTRGVEVEEEYRLSLFGTGWRPDYPDGLEGRRVRARLSYAIEPAWFSPVGDIKAVVVLAGIHDGDDIRPLADRVVHEVVERLSQLLVEAAREAGTEASVVAREGRP